MIKVNKIVKIGENFPTEWIGITDTNQQIEFRYEYGQLLVSIGAVNDMGLFATVNGDEVAEVLFPFFGITMTFNLLKQSLAGKVELPE